MQKRHSLWSAAAAVAAVVAFSSPTRAQDARTWVSGAGNDVGTVQNACSRTAPCKTLSAAISLTNAGGEINCLDPGGYNPLTITKAITIDCHDVFGSVLGQQGAPAFVINAPGSTVRLRNLSFTGAGAATVGIQILAASAVFLEDLTITGFTQQGIVDSRANGGTTLFIKNVTVASNGGVGIVITGTQNTVIVDNSRSHKNLYGLAVAAGNGVIVDRSIFSGNSTAGIEADAGALVMVNGSVMSNNGAGVQASGMVRLSNSDILINGTGISGQTTSNGNNRIFANGSPGTAPTPAGGASPDLGQQ